MDATLPTDNHFMIRALELAQQAADRGEVPVGAVVVRNGKIIGQGHNQPIVSHDPTAHAEIMAMRDASKNLSNYRLTGCDIYVTIEPCTMCVGAMVHARIRQIFFGALEPRAGALTSQLQLMKDGHFNHSILWEGGILADQCAAVLRDFFRQRRS
ncbi:MAG: tRNA adenosine(34) deaminase TadA [SAR92 clade bacterium]|uniref:tRNA-specific adenosine deaminase n=1 Tax=SAR92 clade bacterium TaxID=2315479 RepID=A0A520MP89_9GAMM|nr:MAG: tRNA adenosine(34) deaminase TadA [SAR92 clade bacterium]